MISSTRQHSPTLAAVLIAGSALFACDRNADTADETAPTSTVEGIVESPSTFVGREVTLAGEVEGMPGERAFVLEGNDWIFDEEVLVITSSPFRLAGLAPEEGDDVIVTGMVRTFDTALSQEAFGDAPDEDLAARWAGKPVIMATAIDGIERRARWAADQQETGRILSVWTLYGVPAPEALVGGRLEIENVTVRSKADAGMWVGEAHGSQVFVVPSDPATVGSFDVGARVNVDGTLRKMPEPDEAIKQWGMKPGLRAQIAEEPLYVGEATIEKAQQKGRSGESARATEPPSQ